MTNGEKIKEIFPSMIVGFITESQIGIYFVKNQHSATVFSLDFWNAEYQEPTTKNDLGVDCIDKSTECIHSCIDNNLEVDDISSQISKDMYLEAEYMKKIVQALSSVTPLSSELEKNSKKLEKDFGELDCISRADAIRVASGYCHPSNVAKELAKLPSVTPQEPKWIPTSERLPEEDGEYCATVYDTDENYKYMDIAELENGIWQYKDYIKVLAWMPLPKPYSEVEE